MSGTVHGASREWLQAYFGQLKGARIDGVEVEKDGTVRLRLEWPERGGWFELWRDPEGNGPGWIAGLERPKAGESLEQMQERRERQALEFRYGSNKTFRRVGSALHAANRMLDVRLDEWSIASTGGGCLAYELELPDGGSLMLTSGDGDINFVQEGEPFIVGHYDSEGEERGNAEEFASLSLALDYADKVLKETIALEAHRRATKGAKG